MTGPLRIRTLELDPPLVNASGAFDVDAADPDWAAELPPAGTLGAYVTKSVTTQPRAGNPQPWVDQLGEGTLVNSVGLANPGIEVVLEAWSDLPERLGCPIVLSLSGSADELASMVRHAEHCSWVSAYELNLACPNLGTGDMPAADPVRVGEAVRRVRPFTERPLLVKLTPASSSPAQIARSAEAGGADAITAVNTMPVRALDDDGQPLLGVPDGGMSGRDLHPIALRIVASVTAAVDIPVIGVGGVGSIAAARRMFDAGAQAVGVGTAAALNPFVLRELAAALRPVRV